MAKYLQTAGEANKVALALLELIPDSDRPQAAELIARLVNLSVRCAPRGVQHTVRLNIVRAAVDQLPVAVAMKEVKEERTGRQYHALVLQRLVGPASQPCPATVEGMSEND